MNVHSISCLPCSSVRSCKSLNNLYFLASRTPYFTQKYTYFTYFAHKQNNTRRQVDITSLIISLIILFINYWKLMNLPEAETQAYHVPRTSMQEE